MASPRLYVPDALEPGVQVALSPDQARYLGRVLRLEAGAVVRLFNGRDGEFEAVLLPQGRDGLMVQPQRRTRPQQTAPDLRLLFSPLKRQATDWLVEKATELGVAVLRPVMTKRTVAERVRIERLALIAKEASEQCERLDLPAIAEAVSLGKALDGWDPGTPLLFADEAGDDPALPWGGPAGRGLPLSEAVAELRGARSLALLTGPEGGFDPEERRWLRGLAFVRPVSLGPRILRAETAAVAGLSVVQALWGDRRFLL